MVESGEPRGGASDLVRLEPSAFTNAQAGSARTKTWLAVVASEAGLERIVFALVVVFGIIARYRYVFGLHSPRHYVRSDAGEVIALAHRLADPSASQTIADTIWPPGAAALLAPLIVLDPTLEVAAFLQFAASTATFLLVGYAAYVAAGLRAGQLATLFAAFHFGFVHYAGSFLSEQLFQLAVAIALTVTLIALRTLESRAEVARRGRRFAGLGLLVGLSWGLAASIRPNALPVALLTGACLLFVAVRRREPFRIHFLAGALLAFTLVLAPLTHRCTELSGRVCVVSNNVAMNVALGQAGEVKGLEFRDAAKPELTTSWVPPALLHHGYEAMGSVTRAIYDAPGLIGWVFERLRQDPGMFLVRATGNALDLFRLEYWPDEFGHLPERSATVAKQAFLLLVVAPGLVAWVQVGWKRWRARGASVLPFALVAMFGSVLLSAALSMGEARYRIPFDGVLIVLAATMYARSEPVLFARDALARHANAVLHAAATLAGALMLVVIGVSHPGVGAAARIGASLPTFATELSELRPAKDFDRFVAADSAWDGPGNHRFVCAARCRELVLDFGAPQRAQALELTLDHNDAYRLRFVRQGREVGSHRVAPRSSRGMRSERVSIPPTARDGFDQIALLPLYGDGRYSLGSARVKR